MLENVNITVDDNAPWEIASNDDLKQLPHVINVQCSFKPIQDFLPRRENKSNLNVPFITDSKDKKEFVSLKNYVSRTSTDAELDEQIDELLAQ
jgi:hypothetical protein